MKVRILQPQAHVIINISHLIPLGHSMPGLQRKSDEYW